MYFPLTHAVLPANKIRGFDTKTNIARSVIEQSLKQAAQKASKKAADKYKAFMLTPIKERRVMLSKLGHGDVKFTNNNTTMRIDKRYFQHLINNNMNKQRVRLY
jgi:hypothetical protein